MTAERSAATALEPKALARLGDRGAVSPLVRLMRAPALWLVALVGVSAAVRGAIGVRVPSSWILPDEIVYSELAKSISAGHRPAVRGVPVFGWGEVYPTLIAPAWALLDDPVHAYHAALAISALVMSFAAVPAYALARLFVSRRAALLVAGMTVLVPSMAYTGVLMTENAFYPVFLLAVLLIARAVQLPSLGRQALAIAGLVLVAFTRIQGLALVGAALVAVVIYGLTGRRDEQRDYYRRFLPSAVLLSGATLVPFVASVARGDGPLGWLGSRSGTFDDFHVLEVPEWFLYLGSDLILYVAVIPAAATVVVLARGLQRGANDRVRLFAAVALPTLVATLASVSLVSASLDVDGTENLNERYVFYVVPFFFVGLALWIQEGMQRPRRFAVVVVVTGCLVAAVLPVDRLEYNAGFQSLGLLPWIDTSLSSTVLPVVMATFSLACGLLWLTCGRDRVGRLWLAVGVWMALVGVLAVGLSHQQARNSAYAFDGLSPTWVDDAVPGARDIPVLWDEDLVRRDKPDAFAFWVMVTELFNPDVGAVYRLGRPTYYETFLPTVPVRRGPEGTILDRRGRPLETEYVLVTCRTPVEGTVIAHAPRSALQLVEVEGEIRLARTGACRRSIP